LSEGKTILSVEKEIYADYVLKLICDVLNSSGEIFRSEKGGRCVCISFGSASAEKYISKMRSTKDLLVPKCPNCRQSFLRGVFLACGRASDPSKLYSVEFSLADRSELFFDFLTECGLAPRISDKKSGSAVYFRNSSDIEDLFGFAGFNNAMFSVIEAKFNGEAKRNIHRVTNCIANNIQKAVDASAKQVALISELEEAKLLSSLPEELEATARLRLEYPDLSLSQLSAISVPKVSKPGLSHRLKKIMELGNLLLHKDE
jgi:DNA-binding protein WhiA